MSDGITDARRGMGSSTYKNQQEENSDSTLLKKLGHIAAEIRTVDTSLSAIGLKIVELRHEENILKTKKLELLEGFYEEYKA